MSVELRAQVWAKTDGRCWYCGKLMNPWNDFTVEHQVPKSQGGGDELTNLVPACESCNSRKHAKTVEEYRAYIHEKQIVRFWGEHLRLPVIMPEPEEQSDEEPIPDYLFHIERDLNSCLRLARFYHPGLIVIMLTLYASGLKHYDDRGPEGKYGSSSFSLELLADATSLSIDEVLSHVMTLHNTAIIDIAWGQGLGGGHAYTFDIDMIFERLETMSDHRREVMMKQYEVEEAVRRQIADADMDEAF